MAQTIAMQRGVVSCPNDGIVTLFTQSGGTSTRVIFNQLTWFYNQTSANTNGVITYYNASGGSSIIGFLRNNQSSSQMQFMTTDFGMLSYNNGSSTSPVFSSLGNNAGASYIGANTGSAAPQPNTPSGACLSNMPTNFWIGPSDSIKFTWYHADSGTATVSYSFTTITES